MVNRDCPHCNGDKKVFAFLNNGPDYRTHTSTFIDCRTCLGRGVITREHADRIVAGASMREQRVQRRESLRDAAKRLGITAVELNAIERGD